MFNRVWFGLGHYYRKGTAQVYMVGSGASWVRYFNAPLPARVQAYRTHKRIAKLYNFYR